MVCDLTTTDSRKEASRNSHQVSRNKFFEELRRPLTRNGTPDRVSVAAVLEKYEMTLLGPPLTAD